jgi:hypothetical protein
MIKAEKKADGTIGINLDNGHVIALEKIVQDYQLKGLNEAISFILSVLSEAEGKPINNGKGSFLPSEKLKREVV